MKIAIDLDRTVFECPSLVFHIGNSFPPKLAQFREDVKYRLVDPAEAKSFSNNLFYLKMSHSKNFNQIAESAKYLRELNRLGHEIHFVSSRFDFKAFRKATVEWLEDHDIKFKSLVFACNNKPKFCRNFGFDLLIDDMLNNCLGAQLFGVRAIWVMNKYNQKEAAAKPSYILKATNWSEINEYIKRLELGKQLDLAEQEYEREKLSKKKREKIREKN